MSRKNRSRTEVKIKIVNISRQKKLEINLTLQNSKMTTQTSNSRRRSENQKPKTPSTGRCALQHSRALVLYLVLAEGSLDEARGLVQLSLLGVRQSQLGQVSLHFAVGSIDELAPVGWGGQRGAFSEWRPPGTEAGVGRWGQGLVIQRSKETKRLHVFLKFAPPLIGTIKIGCCKICSLVSPSRNVYFFFLDLF